MSEGLDSNNRPLALTGAGPKSLSGEDEQSAPDAKESQSPRSVRVEVCLGPDCQGGATLLEIEELVSSAGTKSPRPRREVTVGSTGCRDFCTVGPNVYVKSDLADEHFTRVDGPRACREVVSSVLADDASGRVEVLSSTQALLKRREDGIRWRRHKERVCREKRLRVLKREVK